MGTRRTPWLLALLVLIAITATGCQRVAKIIPGNGLTGRPSATPAVISPGPDQGGPTAIPDAQLALAIVQVQPATPKDGGEAQVARSGSGIVVDAEQRLILTSYAVVQPYAADGTPAYSTILISTNRKLGEGPAAEFEADLVAADPANGIAVLRVMRDAGSISLSASKFNLPQVNLGDARTAAAGLTLRVFGHPGPDGGGRPQSLVISKASITGIRGAPGITNRTWLKTDVRMPYGAAGGGAFNQSGALVGMLAQDHYVPTAEVGQLRPLELAQPVIDRARKETTRYQVPMQMQNNVPGTAKPLPTGPLWVSAPVFGANAIQSAGTRDLFDYGTRFPAGRPALYYEYVLQGIPAGTVIEERWFLDGVPQDSLSSSYRWDGRGIAVQGDRVTAPGAAGIPRGRWRIEVWAGGALRAQSTALVGVDTREVKVTPAGAGSAAAPDAKPSAALSKDSTQALVFFDFSGMEAAQTLDWIVFHNNQGVYTSPSLRWDYGDSGRTWIGFAPGRALGSGRWEFELHVDGKVVAVLPAPVP